MTSLAHARSSLSGSFESWSPPPSPPRPDPAHSLSRPSSLGTTILVLPPTSPPSPPSLFDSVSHCPPRPAPPSRASPHLSRAHAAPPPTVSTSHLLQSPVTVWVLTQAISLSSPCHFGVREGSLSNCLGLSCVPPAQTVLVSRPSQGCVSSAHLCLPASTPCPSSPRPGFPVMSLGP